MALLSALLAGAGLVLWFLWQFRFACPAVATGELPFQPMGRFRQWLVVIVAFGVKPAYMALSLGLIVWLWRQRARDLVALRWGLIWFWLGEGACAVNFLAFQGECDFWEYLHNLGMAAGFSMIAYALLEGLDWRIIKFSPQTERCAALTLCRTCFKHAEAPCGLKRLFTALIPALMVLALIPLPVPFATTSYKTAILGSPYNYSHLLSAQWFELRACPVLALLLLAASWLVLLFRRREPVPPAKALFAAAFGPLSFGLLRLFLVFTFVADQMWFETWEEVTEMIFVFSVAVVLWVFRERLFLKEAPAQPTQTDLGQSFPAP